MKWLAMILTLAATFAWSEEKKTPGQAGQLEEIVIKGEESQKMSATKPAITLDVDSAETLRPSLKPPEHLLLAEHPQTFTSKAKNPLTLRNLRVIEPWRTLSTPRFVLRPVQALENSLGKPTNAKDAKNFNWSVTIVDQEGKAFHSFEGRSSPPEQIVWNGQNGRKEWVHPGQSYSAVYSFTDAAGLQHTAMGDPVLSSGMVIKTEEGDVVGLDSGILFGNTRQDKKPSKEGEELLRAAADYAKRHHPQSPLRVRVYAKDQNLASAQADAVRKYLATQFMASAEGIPVEAKAASFGDSRVEIILSR